MDPFKQAQAAIAGDLDIAVTAQVNRWAGRLGIPEFPLSPGALTPAVAGYAVSLLKQRLALALVTSADPALLMESVTLSQATANPYAYVQANREIVVRTLAHYGDSLRLPAAKAGITVKQWGRQDWLAAGSLALIGGVVTLLGARAIKARLRR